MYEYYIKSITGKKGDEQYIESIPKIRDVIDSFKERCKWMGWDSFEKDDLIEAEKEYHKFVWINQLHPYAFQRLVLNHLWNLYAIREGASYRTVTLSYIAWVLSEAPYEGIWHMFDDSPTLSERVALYDLSQTYKGEPKVPKINETKSVVLREFEQFLNREYGITFAFPLKSSRTGQRKLTLS